jgi:hypothetical protein
MGTKVCTLILRADQLVKGGNIEWKKKIVETILQSRVMASN